MRLIGIVGRMGSGKDTAYEFILDRLGDIANVERHAFADALKLSAAAALGFEPGSAAEGVAICNKLKESGRVVTTWDDPKGFPMGLTVSGREFLQLYGTESHRDVFGTDFWVDALLPVPRLTVDNLYDADEGAKLLEARFPDVDVIVVTDVRFDNEAQRIRNLGGELWHIDADQRLGPLPDDAHPSEHGVNANLVTNIIPNNSDLYAFRAAITEDL